MAFLDKPAEASPPLRSPGGLPARFVRRMLGPLASGRLTIVLPSGERIEHRGREAGPAASLVLHRWRALRRLLTSGDPGLADAYVDGDWSSPDLASLLELAARNIDRLDRSLAGLLPMRIAGRVRHILRSNSKAGSRRNISYHYDLGNEFYRCWLDSSMSYSAALYARSDQTLEDAQDAKLSRIVELLELRGGASVLEIGCGWGALALRLARSGARVKGVTLSAEQLAFARQRVVQEKLSEKVCLELTDYRDVAGTYDRIVSIEMLEAVGEAYWPLYFRSLQERLRPGGLAVLQVITIDERRFEAYRRSADFIQRHIFPGGMLPTRSMIATQAKAAGLTLASTQCFGDSYAQTLAEWRARFLSSWPRIGEMGFDERFRRLWEYYLCYCEAGFRARTIDVGLFVLRKDGTASTLRERPAVDEPR